MTKQPGTPCNPVKEVRQALGLSQELFARELGTSQTAVWRWEQKDTLPTVPAVLARLLYLMGIE